MTAGLRSGSGEGQSRGNLTISMADMSERLCGRCKVWLVSSGDGCYTMQ